MWPSGPMRLEVNASTQSTLRIAIPFPNLLFEAGSMPLARPAAPGFAHYAETCTETQSESSAYGLASVHESSCDLALHASLAA